MQRLSVFDMLKIGVGPSSSHTMGPWTAARRFVSELQVSKRSAIEGVTVDLYGSLAKTGKGHGTDIAVQLGLAGYDPEQIDTSRINDLISGISNKGRIKIAGEQSIPFVAQTDIVFHFDQSLPGHPNALRLTAKFSDGSDVCQTYFSIGGGFVIKEGEVEAETEAELPFPIDTAAQLLQHCKLQGCPISEIVMRNELAWRDEAQVMAGLDRIAECMIASVYRGCRIEGILPGGLHVRRRAARMAKRLLGKPCADDVNRWINEVRNAPHDFQQTLDWVSCFAMAVNEENAAFGRIVTAPTNGAAGVLPAVLLYLECCCNATEKVRRNFLMTAAEIGCLFKKGATISAALGGCQAEIGVSSAMAAAALTEALGGAPAQATEAAEIAMEHHLGMTCDPIGGLVQVPCIERNAMGAIKAITAAQLALQRSVPETRVSLDDVIRTMWQTAQDMSAKYKETSEGGLAVQIPVNVAEC